MAKVTVRRAGRQNQIVIRNRDVLPVGVTHKDALLVFVYSRDFTQNHDGVPLLTEYSADGSRNLARRQHRSCHLVEQWLKQVVVSAIDQNNFSGRVLQSLGGG